MVKKVCLFLPHISDGGAERVLLNLGRHWAAQGHKVDVHVACRVESTAPIEVDDFEIHEGGHASTLSYLPSLVSYLKREIPDSLLSALPHGNIVASIAHRLARAPGRLVLSEHVRLQQDVQRSWTWKRLLLPFVMSPLYARAHAVVAVSDGVARELQEVLRLPPGLCVTIPNPVITDDFERRVAEEPTGLWPETGSPVLVGVGRLTPQKDFPTLLRAFAQLRAIRPLQLILIGEGEQREELVRLAAELGVKSDVEFLGTLSNPLPHMRKADVFVHTARYEGLGNVLIEALACGTPVVCTDCPYGPRDVVERLGNAELVPVGDVDAIAKAIATILERGRGVAPTRAALGRYHVRQVAAQYASCLWDANGSANV